MFLPKKLIRLICSSNDKTIQLIDLIETYAYETSKDLVSEKEDNMLNITKQYKMTNFDDVVKERIEEANPNWSQIPDHPYRVLIIGGSGSGKTNSVFNFINQLDIEKISLYPKYQQEAKYQFFINKSESTGLKHRNDSKVFIEYSNDMDDF